MSREDRHELALVFAAAMFTVAMIGLLVWQATLAF